MRLSLTARTPGVNSAARQIACFSARERTPPTTRLFPSCTITLSREGLAQLRAQRESSSSRIMRSLVAADCFDQGRRGDSKQLPPKFD
jgi:hypothetical protein